MGVPGRSGARDPVTGGLRITEVVVVGLAGDRICEITRFETALAPYLGLPGHSTRVRMFDLQAARLDDGDLRWVFPGLQDMGQVHGYVRQAGERIASLASHLRSRASWTGSGLEFPCLDLHYVEERVDLVATPLDAARALAAGAQWLWERGSTEPVDAWEARNRSDLHALQ